MFKDISKIVIVGKGSKLYQRLKHNIEIDIIELSTAEARMQINYFDNTCLIIIFSLFDTKELKEFLDHLKCKSITVGSISALSRLAARFKYSALKKRQLDVILELNDTNHKIVLFGDFSKKEFIGKYYHSDLQEFWPALNHAILSDMICSVSAVHILDQDPLSKFLSCVEILASPISSLLLKKLTKRVYGYIDANNYKQF